MRVYELARELGMETKELLPLLQEMGFAVKAPASGIDDERVEAIKQVVEAVRSVEVTPADDAGDGGEIEAKEGAAVEPSAAPPAPVAKGEREPTPRWWKLVRKGSVSAGGVVVRKGEEVEEGTYATLPRRVRAWFDPVE